MPGDDEDNVVLPSAQFEQWKKQYQEMEQLAHLMKQQNETLQGQVQSLTASQGAARIAVEDLRKRAQKLIQHQPKYSHENPSKRTWQMFQSERQDFFEGHGITIDTIGEDYHKRYLMMALQGRAREMIVGIEDDLKAKNYAGMIQQLTEQFAPRQECELLKSQFRARKQGRGEDVITYLSSKEALYRRAYAPSERTITHFMESAIANIYNDRVKEALIIKRYDPRNVITDYMQLREFAASSVAMEREMRKAGLPYASTTLDGLQATSLAVTQGEDNEDEKMDINKVEDRACYICSKKGHLARDCRLKGKQPFVPRGGSGKPNPGKSGKPFPFNCRKCGKLGHKAADCRSGGKKEHHNKKVKQKKAIKSAGGADQGHADETESEESDSDAHE